jgi:acetylornithine deacetylase
LSACHEEAHGSRPPVGAGRATTDLRWFHPGQAACYGPASSGSHAVDEWVSISSIADVATVLALLLRSWGAT